MPTTEAVLEHHLDAYGEQDMDEILADYTDDSVVVTPMGSFDGLADIEELFEGLFEEFGKEGVTMDVTQQTVADDHAVIIWNAETPDNVYEYATDTFHVVDGDIVFQSFAGKITPKD